MSSNCGSGNVEDICRICHGEGGPDFPLSSPCYCSGSVQYVHQLCLQQWIKSSGTRCCELCKFHFIIHTKLKPFREWEKVDLSLDESRDVEFIFIPLLFYFTFLVVSLCVQIKLTEEERLSNVLVWWIVLILDVMGLVAALILTYIKGKAFRKLFRRWKAFNSIIYVQKRTREKRHGAAGGRVFCC